MTDTLATRSLLAAAVIFGLLTIESSARAQDSSAAVEGLFNEGKRLVGEGKLVEACPKFLASYKLDPRIGTLLNLADCYERTGQTASAWARFVEARTLAGRAGQQERADYASEHASLLEPKLNRLTIHVPENSAVLTVKRDGITVEPATYGVAVPIDTGKHLIEASAAGKSPWSGTVAVMGEASRAEITVPPLADAPQQATGPEAHPAEAPRGMSGRAIAGIAIAGAGIVAAGVGAGFGIAALGSKSDAEPYCGQNGAGKDDCIGPGAGFRSDAVSQGNLSTIFLSAGAVLAIGGVVLWLTAPRASSTRSAFDTSTKAIRF